MKKSEYKYTFTVLTATYNRKNLLPRVYKCLLQQTYKNFEWLIVDDGSTDGTRQLVKEWQNENKIVINYFWQENGGKHRAVNRGLEEAQGAFFILFDSDDKCTKNALERFKYYWDLIPIKERSGFTAVTAMSAYEDGTCVGQALPKEIIDSNSIELRDKYKVTGDKWGFQKTDIFKQHMFPEFDGENFITEAIVWNRIAVKYKTRYVNEALCIKEYQNSGLTASTLFVRIKNPKGTLLYYNEYQKLPVSFFSKIKAVINYIRFSCHSGKSFFNIIRNVNMKLIAILFFLPAYIFYRKDL